MTINVLQVVVVLLVLGLVWWLFNRYILPVVPEPFRTAIIVVLVLAAILWLLALVGLAPVIHLRT